MEMGLGTPGGTNWEMEKAGFGKARVCDARQQSETSKPKQITQPPQAKQSKAKSRDQTNQLAEDAKTCDVHFHLVLGPPIKRHGTHFKLILKS